MHRAPQAPIAILLRRSYWDAKRWTDVARRGLGHLLLRRSHDLALCPAKALFEPICHCVEITRRKELHWLLPLLAHLFHSAGLAHKQTVIAITEELDRHITIACH